MRPPGIALLAAAVAAGISASSAQKIRVCADAGQRSQECGASNASRPQLCCRGLVCSGSMAAGQAYRCVEGGDGAGGDGAGGDDTATATDISNGVDFDFDFDTDSKRDGGPYSAPAYAAPRAVHGFHSVPRFGRTSSISALASFRQRDQVEYASGLVFATSALIAVFLFWTVLVLVLSCMGKERVGFLSGSPMTDPAESHDYGNGHHRLPFRRPRRVRAAFLVCAVAVVASASLLVGEGLSRLEDALNTLEGANDELKFVAGSAARIADSLEEVRASTDGIKGVLAERLERNFCPMNPDLQRETGYDFDDIASEGMRYLERLDRFVDEEVAALRAPLANVDDVTARISSVLETYDVNDPRVRLYIVPVILLSCVLAFATVLAWLGLSYPIVDLVLRWAVVPLFGAFVVFTWLCASVFGLTALINSDLCSGGGGLPSPDGTVMDVMREQAYDNPDLLLYRSISHYVGGCSSPSPFGFVADYASELGQARDGMDQLRNTVEQIGTDQLERLCGIDFVPVQNILTEVNDNLDVLADSAERTLALTSCPAVNSLYVDAVHRGVCTESATGVVWIFSCLLVIAVCGMVMLVLRSALYVAKFADSVESISDQRLPRDASGRGGWGDETYFRKDLTEEGNAPTYDTGGSNESELGTDHLRN